MTDTDVFVRSNKKSAQSKPLLVHHVAIAFAVGFIFSYLTLANYGIGVSTLSDWNLFETPLSPQTEDAIDLMQVQFLDFLNGESGNQDSHSTFGGSLLYDKAFNSVQTWRYVHAFAKQIIETGYDSSNFHHMVLGARAHYIAHKILYNTPKSLVRRLAHVSPERRLEKLQGSLHSIISKLQHMLYPWLEESFSTALEMQASLPMDSIGIAMTCGNTHFYLAQHLILSLRNVFNVTIPIEVFYAGPSDLTVQKINVLNSMPGVEAVNLFNFFTNETLKGNGWSFKPFAILAARFRTVLFMDPDIAFLKNPMTILDSPLFRKNGLVYYRDRKVWHPERLELVGLFNAMNPHMSNYAFSGSFARSAEDGFQGTTEEMESGFIPVDKGNTGVLFSLLLAAKMNSKQERDTVFYKLAHGDKESFWFASESLRVIYAFNPSYSGSIGILGLKRDDKHTSVCVGKHLHSNEFQEPFWFHDGSVLIDYRQFGPPNFRFSELTHMALHYDFELEEQAWHDGINCLERPNEQTFPVEGEIANLLDHYRAMYRDEIVKVD